MGACGTGPDENDTAMDVEASLFESEDFDEQRYGAWLLTHMNSTLPYFEKRVAIALNNMKKLLQNKRWLNMWYERESIVESIKEQISALEKIPI